MSAATLAERIAADLTARGYTRGTITWAAVVESMRRIQAEVSA